MTHEHHHNHLHDRTGNIKIAFFLNLSFTILEIFGGLWTNSMAILSDAVHDLGDSISLGMAWYLERVSRRGSDHKYTYGYRRFSLLGALINTIVLIVGSIFILMEAIPRLVHPEQTNAQGMALFAVIGIVVNGAAILKLRTGKSMNEQVLTWHLLEDVLGWAAVLIVSIVLLFWDIPILDSILSIGITCYILFNVVKNFRKTLALFLQAAPENMDIKQIQKAIENIEYVISTHHPHIWSLDGEENVLSMHVVVQPDITIAQVMCIKEEIRNLVNAYDILHVTIDIEYGESDCVMAAAKT